MEILGAAISMRSEADRIYSGSPAARAAGFSGEEWPRTRRQRRPIPRDTSATGVTDPVEPSSIISGEGLL